MHTSIGILSKPHGGAMVDAEELAVDMLAV
jgi:hypothetical protein